MCTIKNYRFIISALGSAYINDYEKYTKETGKFDLTNVNNMAFYISGPKLLFETTEISTHPNSTQQESNYIYLYTIWHFYLRLFHMFISQSVKLISDNVWIGLILWHRLDVYNQKLSVHNKCAWFGIHQC
jgi:hypothetical protein